MPWAQFDDHFPDSEGALTAGVEACGLHLLASCWCAAQLSDGILPAIVAKRLLSGCHDEHGAELVARLMNSGLWQCHEDGGYLLIDFLTTNGNRTRSKVAEDRERKAKAGRQGGRSNAARNRQARSQARSTDSAERDAQDAGHDPDEDYLKNF